MNHQKNSSRAGFTLVELLVVIGIIGILAALSMAVLPKMKQSQKKSQARLECLAIVNVILQYDSKCGHLPVSEAVQALHQTNDFTFGGAVFSNAAMPSLYWTNNSEVMAILMDVTNYPNGTGATANMNHQKNPQRTVFLTADRSADPTLPGVGPDLVYRDPWGNPYIISMDLNDDNYCNDALYQNKTVSQTPQNSTSQQGYNGLANPDANGATDNFRFSGKVMVWSPGPDGKISQSDAANQGANKDNVVSW